MIWDIFLERTKQSFKLHTESTIQINETDLIVVELWLDKKDLNDNVPYLTVGDVPIRLIQVEEDESRIKFTSVKYEKHIDNLWFYNFFGKSCISLYYQGLEIPRAVIYVDIRARKANADLACSMLDFVSDNLEDALLLCFSRGKSSIEAVKSEKDTIDRTNFLKEIIEYILNNQTDFFKKYNYDWKNKIELTESGQSSGPKSIEYIFKNLDKLSPTSRSNANIVYENRGYVTDKTPNEILIHNPDVYENRVILSFLKSGLNFLSSKKNKLIIGKEKNRTNTFITESSEDYISFDNTLAKYKRQILNQQVVEVESLISKIQFLIHRYQNQLGVKHVPNLTPKATSFISKRPTFRLLYSKISDWYTKLEAKRQENKLLLGFKNLASVYEITSLLFIYKILRVELGLDLEATSYFEYTEHTGYSGEVGNRPNNLTNNVFTFIKTGPGEFEHLNAQLRIEPKIYAYNKEITKPNDFINIKNKEPSKKYGAHYYKPDFVLNFSSPKWKEDITIVLDSKYKSRDKIAKGDLDSCEDKYLRTVYQYKENGEIGSSTVKLLILLYAHGSNKIVSNLSPIHWVTEELTVYPQSVGLKSIPNNFDDLKQWLAIALKKHDEKVRFANSNSLPNEKLIPKLISSKFSIDKLSQIPLL